MKSRTAYSKGSICQNSWATNQQHSRANQVTLPGSTYTENKCIEYTEQTDVLEMWSCRRRVEVSWVGSEDIIVYMKSGLYEVS